MFLCVVSDGDARSEADVAAGRRLFAKDHSDQRRLAGAVRPDEPADDAVRNGERDAVERDDAAEAYADVLDGEQCIVMHASSRHVFPWSRTAAVRGLRSCAHPDDRQCSHSRGRVRKILPAQECFPL